MIADCRLQAGISAVYENPFRGIDVIIRLRVLDEKALIIAVCKCISKLCNDTLYIRNRLSGKAGGMGFALNVMDTRLSCSFVFKGVYFAGLAVQYSNSLNYNVFVDGDRCCIECACRRRRCTVNGIVYCCSGSRAGERYLSADNDRTRTRAGNDGEQLLYQAFCTKRNELIGCIVLLNYTCNLIEVFTHSKLGKSGVDSECLIALAGNDSTSVFAVDGYILERNKLCFMSFTVSC
ncbi:hypothetical protein D3C75_304440 [compost metagenome]